jgi:hypothetical protein
MEKIIVGLVLFILGGFMVLFTNLMIRFQIWTQHVIMGAQYTPSKRTYTAVRIVGILILVLGLFVVTGILK